MIQNERIDEISKTINSDFDSLLDLQDAGNPLVGVQKISGALGKEISSKDREYRRMYITP